MYIFIKKRIILSLRFKTSLFVFITIIFSLSSCNNHQNEQSKNIIKNDSLFKINEKRKFDSIGAIADFITNSGGRLTTKETKAIYFADTNIIGNLMNYAFTLIEEKNFKLAFYYLNKAYLKNVNYRADVYLYKGIAWNELKNKDSMYFYFDKAVNEDTIGIKYLQYRAIAFVNDSLFEKAIIDITEAIRRQPNNKGLRVTRGRYKIGINDFKSAAEDLQEIPSSMSKDFMVYSDRAYVALQLGGFESAIEQSNISINLNPNYGNSYTIRGIAKNKLGDKDGAYLDFKKAYSLGDIEAKRFLQQYEEYYRTHKNI